MPHTKPELKAWPHDLQALPKGTNFTGGMGGSRRAPRIPSASCCSLLHFSLPLSSSFYSNKWTFPLVPCKASPPTPRPLEISPSAVSTHQGIVSNQVSFLRGKRVHLLHLALPVSDGDTLLSPVLTSVSPPLPSTSQLFQTTFPLQLLSLSCLSPHSNLHPPPPVDSASSAFRFLLSRPRCPLCAQQITSPVGQG